MNALADEDVGEYLNKHFVSTFFKIGSFTVLDRGARVQNLVPNQVKKNVKVGGNVASYFCRADGSVIHVVPGPVNAATLLREARWAVDTHKVAWLETKNDPKKYKRFFQLAHAERLKAEHGYDATTGRLTPNHNRMQGAFIGIGGFRRFPNYNGGRSYAGNQAWMMLSTQGKAHYTMVKSPLVKLENVYKYVFEKILYQKVSTLPVKKR